MATDGPLTSDAHIINVASKATTWTAAGAVFYVFIYRPEEAKRARERAEAVVVLDRQPSVGKRRTRAGGDSAQPQ